MYHQFTDDNEDVVPHNYEDKTYGNFLETYQQFSPLTLSSQLTRRRMLGQTELEPYCQTVFAAVLFADISGFTRLSARLSEEELKFHINQYFTALLGVVQQNNGDTIKFCGDAVMIMWSVDVAAGEDVKAAAVLMASLCAIQLLGDCGKYDRGEGTRAVSLRLHCGIGCGEMHCMCVGEGSRWEFLICGDPLRQVGLAEPEAGIGEVCLSPEAVHYVQHKLDSELMPKGSHRLTGGLRRNRPFTSTLALSQFEDSYDCIPSAGESFDQVVRSFDDEANLFSTDQYSTKNPGLLDFSKLAKESWVEDGSDEILVKRKRQVNAKYVPLGTSIAVTVHPKGSSGNNSAVSSSAKGSESILNSATREHASAQDFFEPEDSETAACTGMLPPHPTNESASKHLFSCFPCFTSRNVSPIALSTIDESPAPQFSEAISPNIKNRLSPATSAPGTPDTSSHAMTKKRSFINDISFRLKNKDSFIFPVRRNSNRDFDRDLGIARDRPFDVSFLKTALGVDTDPSIAKARNYLSNLSIRVISKNESATAKAVSACNSDRILNSDREDMSRILRRFIHDAALKAIESDLFDFGYLAEKRMVVTMFIKIIGLDDDFSMGQVKRPQRAMSYALACIKRFEGSLRQYVVDDKGCVLIAAFGLPGSHHEDNCTRAVETAKAIQKSFETMQLTCQTGIAMGSVYCGLVGSRARCEYAMMGSSVNLAARLMVKCDPGFILVNDTVFQGASQDFEFQTLEPMHAKGYENRVDVYCPGHRVQSRTIGLGIRLNQHCKFIGRTEEKLMFQQDLMNFGYGDASQERTSAHIIDGPAGIGKTSLIAEINEIAKSNANITSIAIASASASHMSSSYFVIRQILDVIFTLDTFKKQANIGSIKGKRNQVKGIDSIRDIQSPSFRNANSGSSDLLNSDTPFTYAKDLISSANSIRTNMASLSESSQQLKPISAAQSWLGSTEKVEVQGSLSQKARTLMKLPSSILDKRFFGMDNVPHKETVLDTIISWIEHFGSEIMVTELDPIGAFESSNAFGKANSFEVIYGTGGTNNSNIYNSMSNSNNIYGTGGSASTNVFGTGGAASVLDRSRSDMSGRGNEEVFSDDGQQVFSMKTLLPLLSDILPVSIKENNVTKTLTPAMRWRLGDALIVQLMRVAMVDEKIVFIVENLQWCDYQSLTVLTYFIRDTVGGLLIGTERPAESSIMSTKIQRGRYSRMMTSLRSMCHITTLQPLFDIEVQRVMEEVVGKDRIDSFPMLKTDDAIHHIIRRTSGQPFAIIALCLALKDAIKHNKFVDIDRLSSGVHNIILNRFDQLSNTEKVVLKIASVIGREFEFQLLKQALMDLNYSNCTSALYHTLEQLASAKLIKIMQPEIINHDKAGDSDSEEEEHDKVFTNFGISVKAENIRPLDAAKFEFIDQSVQGGIYNLMLEEQRQLAHSVIGALFEKRLNENDRDADLFANVVHHYNLSSDLEKKLMYLRFAAKDAESGRNYKMAIHYNTELIKFATNMSLETLLDKCCGKEVSHVTSANNENAILHEKISVNHSIGKAGINELHVVRNIFAARTGIQHRGSASAIEVISPNDGWLDLRRVIKQFVVTEEAAELGVTKEDVCNWLSVVSDAETRVGLYHRGSNLAIVCLRGMNCSLSVNNSCFGVIKRKLYLQHYPQFTQSKVLMQVLISYENLAFLLLMRGLPDLALNSLKMVSKILKHSPPTWLSKMERIICRVNGLYSLAYLGVGETAKAAVLISAAEMQKQSHFDAYTNSCVTYMNTFHLAAKGEFQAAFNGCMESIEVLSFIGELGLAHLIRISAGWYSFIIGNVNRARELYEEVFEYGLSTAHRPLIKMSMELYASILILSGDFASANAMLDHLKSPLQASDSREATLRPSSIKSSLITMSCVLDKRYIEAIPHIQFSCRTLAEINPANVICGVYLFFAAYSALEVLVNLSLLEFHERVTANIVLNEAIGLSMSALERCSHSIPCLRLLYEVCIVKRQRMNPAASMSTISEIDAVIKKLAGEKEIELGMPYLHTSTNETNNTFPQLGSKGIARKEYSSMVVLANSNASPSSQHSSMMLNDHSRKGVWESVGNIGVFDEFTLGKLFYHREREALCKVVHADKKFKESNFDSGILYLKLSRLYHRELSYSSLLPVYYDVPIEHAPENSFHVDKIVPVRSDISDNSFRLPLAEESSIGGTDCTVKDFNRVVEDADSSVYVQLDKLRAYELMQGLEVDELPVAMAGIGSLKRYTSEKGGSFNQDKATLPDLKPRRLFPIGATIRIAPTALIDNDKSPKIKQKQSNVRRGSR